MSREKQIEEMAKEICQLERDCNECWHNGVCQAKKYAKRAINAGYRKVVTSDWLTKGISEEQLEREKQEALDEFAEKLGYRKQSEGEWISVEGDVIFKCSICDAEISTSWDYENNDMWGFCPCCGANMKGGTEIVYKPVADVVPRSESARDLEALEKMVTEIYNRYVFEDNDYAEDDVAIEAVVNALTDVSCAIYKLKEKYTQGGEG